MPEETIPEKATDTQGDDEFDKSLVASISRSKDYSVVYSNFVQCGFTAWDIRVNFGLVGLSETGQPTMTEQVAVVLTPQMAKALVGVLNGHVKAYERDNGEVQMPASVVREGQARKAQTKEQAQPSEAKTKE